MWSSRCLCIRPPLQKIPVDYGLATVSQAEQHLTCVARACCLAGVETEQEIRLKNGFVQYKGENPCEVHGSYRGFNIREKLKYRLVSKPKSGKELKEEECLIALAYAAEHDDVDNEVEELVKCAGKQILSTKMPFVDLGTVLHGCALWGSINMLEKVLKDYPKDVDVYIQDKDGDTALHNLSNSPSKPYDACKRAACLLLGLDGVNANELLSKQNNYGQWTALCKALWGEEEQLCRALLDAGKEMEEKEEPATLEASKACVHWLTLRTHEKDDQSYTALDLAIFREYEQIVKMILAYPGAKGLTLTKPKDQDGDTPVHNAARIGKTEICSMLLKYCNDGTSVTSKNKNDETPLHIASGLGHAEVCEKLIEYGASVDLADKYGGYALTNALFLGHNQAVKKLLDACLPRSAKDASSTATQPKEGASSFGNTKSQPSLINEQFQSGVTPLHAAVQISSERHISDLLKAGAVVEKRDDDGKTPLHVAAEKEFYKKDILIKLLETNKISLNEKEWINMKDKWGKTALHYILDSLSKHSANEGVQGRKAEGESSTTERESGPANIQEITDHEGTETDSITNEICEMVSRLINKGAWVDVQNCDGETALHVAAQGHHKAVHTLLSQTSNANFESSARADHRDNWIAMCDFSGETALHEAVRSDSLEIVRQLLSETDSPGDLIRVRDMENKTALAWAALKPNNKLMIDEMMDKIDDETTKHFLMWNLKEHVDPPIHKQHCETHKVNVDQTQLLRAAVTDKDLDIAKELINRGANIRSLKHDELRWLDLNLCRKASDQPTLEDTLGRKELVRGVASLLLNPYTQTPLTIGIFGRWGSGKSSFMLQVEEAMLYMAVKEAFRKTPNYIPSHDKDSYLLKLSTFGVVLRYMVVKALKQRMGKAPRKSSPIGDIENQEITFKATKKSTPNADSENQDKKHSPNADIENQAETSEAPINANIENQETSKAPQESSPSADIENQLETSKAPKESNPNSNADIENQDEEINDFPMELQSKYHQLFKHLALTDRSKLVQSHRGAWYKRKVGMNNQTLQDAHLIGYTPAVLTLHYNAWQYDNKTEASAGLAVEICHQLEKFMTPHQWLRMCWKYSWNSRPRDIFVHLLLPAFLALVVVCVVLILWKFVHIATKFKALALPMGIVGVMWSFFKISLQVIQPVTITMLNNTKSIDHRSMLGYQHQVIDDINFLKEQLCHDAHFGWKILSFLCQMFISNKYFMEGTWICKQHPQLNNFRIVMFIDDLDRCEEKTILEILRAISLILGACGINVVIGVDKNMVQRAITKEFLNDINDMESMEDMDGKTVAPDQGNVQNVVEMIADKKTMPDLKGSHKAKRNEKMVNNYEDLDRRQFTDIYLQKIIQLPIQIPDPSKTTIEHFLEVQVGQRQHLSRLQKDKTEGLKQEFQKDKQKGNKEENLESKGLQEIDKHSQSQDGIGAASDSMDFCLILENYTPMEKDILRNLCLLATKERRFPREWKRFLNYHRLAWTILSQDPNMKRNEFKGWQRKLILWIFLCWNWRDQMDMIFEIWPLQGKDKNNDTGLENIISNYMESKGWSTKNANKEKGKQGGEIAPQDWIDLHKTLKDKYDIPMHFIEKFQQFRFYCKLDHLEIIDQYKSK